MTPNEALQAAKDALDIALAEKKQNQEVIKNLGVAVVDTLRPVLDELATNSKLSKDVIEALKPTLESLIQESKLSSQEIIDAIAKININVPAIASPNIPEIKIPEIKVPQPIVTVSVPPVKIPEIKIPKIVIPKPEVTVNIPPIKIPKLEWPTEDMSIKGWVGLMGIDLQHPLPVQIMNPKDIGGNSTVVGGRGDFFTIAGFNDSAFANLQNADGRLKVSVETGGSGLTDNELRASSIPVSQVSGAIWSVSATFSGATVTTLINNDGLAYNSDNPLPITGTLSTTPGATFYASDAVGSVNVIQYGGVTVPAGLNETTGGVTRVVQMTDSVSSVVVNSGTITTVSTVTGITNTVTARLDSPDGAYTAANPLPITIISDAINLDQTTDSIAVRQVSGFTDSVNITNSTLAVTQSGAWDVDNSGTFLVQVQDSQASTITSHQFATDFRGLDIYIGGATASTFSELLNADGRVKSEISTIAGLNETNSGVIRTVQMTDSVSSVNVINSSLVIKSLATGENEDTSEVLKTYQVTSAINSVNVVTFNSNTPATGLNETNNGVLRVVQMTDSISSVSAAQSGTWNIGTVTTVTGITNTVVTRLDSPDGLYSAANPLPITLVSGALTSTIAVGAVVAGAADDGSAPIKMGGIARTANPTAVTGGQQVSFSADKIGRQINRPLQIRDLIATAYISLTNGTEATFLAAGGTGVFLDCISVICSNASDAAVMVDFRAVTGGNIEFSIEVPASGPGGIAHPIPWPQSATNNNWTVDMPDITGTTVNISGLFSKEI